MKNLKSKNGITLSDTGAGWEIIRQGVFDYADYMEGPQEMGNEMKIARNLIINIGLPGISKANDIDISVLPKIVKVKARIHDFEIPLPFEVDTAQDYKASWASPIIKLTLAVKSPDILVRKPFVAPTTNEEEEEQEITFNEEKMEDVAATKNEDITEIKKAKFNLSVDEKVVTIILYVAYADVDSLRINDNRISICNKKGQEYEAYINPPFPLTSVRHVSANPVNVRLIFTEDLEPLQPDIQPKHPLDDITADPQFEFKNKYVFELEP